VTPKVSVLLPVYNGGDLVSTAIDSVLAQTFTDFELLLIDDCSTDDSAAAICAYDDPRIRLLRNERNVGQVATLNRGLREVRAPYVARLDQDDACLPHRLERQVALLDAEPEVAVVGTWMDVCDDDDHLVWELRGTIGDRAHLVFLILTNQLPIAHPTVMFRRDPVLALGGYDVSVKLAEDQDLWRRLVLAGHAARVVEEPLLRYRLHAGQQSQQRWEEQQVSNRRALDRFIAELAGEEDATAIRLLLTWDDEFWSAHGTHDDAARVAGALERLLSGARARLDLTENQAATLDEQIRARVTLAARRSWRSGVLRHWRTSRPLLHAGVLRLPPARRRRAQAVAAFVYATAPVLAVLLRGERLGQAVWEAERVQPVKRRAKRTRAARLAYRAATRGRSTR